MRIWFFFQKRYGNAYFEYQRLPRQIVLSDTFAEEALEASGEYYYDVPDDDEDAYGDYFNPGDGLVIEEPDPVLVRIMLALSKQPWDRKFLQKSAGQTLILADRLVTQIDFNYKNVPGTQLVTVVKFA